VTPQDEAADAVLELTLGRVPTLGGGRLVCVDGPAGSGKTTLADRLRRGSDRLDRRSTVVHMDDLYAGWSGLAQVDAQLEGLLGPMAAGEPGRYRRFDWEAGTFAETVVVPPVPVLVLEGVGSGSARFEHLRTVLVWVEAPYDVRMSRGLERDGEAFAPHWEQWAQDEGALFARERTRERADLLLETG
jgi:uridine kinase